MEIKTTIDYESLARAVLVLMGEGIDKDQAEVVLQAIGYALLDVELFPEDDEFFDEDEVDKLIDELEPLIFDEDEED